MQILSNFKNFFTVGLILSLIACNSGISNVKETKNNKTENDTLIAPPLRPPPGVEMDNSFPLKCFENKGLKYNTKVNIIFLTDTTVAGQITSYNLKNYKEETTGYEGIISGEKIIIKFTTPV